MTKEQDIYNFVFTEMLKISIANGFSFDISGRVFDWRDSPFEDSELPAINVRDVTNEIVDADTREHTLTFDIALEDVGENAADSIRGKKQDILTAFSNIIQSDLVVHAFFLASETFSEKEKRFAVFTSIQFEVTYFAEDEWKRERKKNHKRSKSNMCYLVTMA